MTPCGILVLYYFRWWVLLTQTQDTTTFTVTQKGRNVGIDVIQIEGLYLVASAGLSRPSCKCAKMAGG